MKIELSKLVWNSLQRKNESWWKFVSTPYESQCEGVNWSHWMYKLWQLLDRIARQRNSRFYKSEIMFLNSSGIYLNMTSDLFDCNQESFTRMIGSLSSWETTVCPLKMAESYLSATRYFKSSQVSFLTCILLHRLLAPCAQQLRWLLLSPRGYQVQL